MTQTKFSYFLFLLIAALGVVSCSQFRPITIENQYLPKVMVPNEIQSLTLLNRSMTPEFLNFDEDSLQRYFYRKEFSVDINILDSLASDTCLQAIGDLLYESGRFDIVIPVERNIPKESKYYIADQPLEWAYVENVCQTYNTDALLVMEKFVTHVNSKFKAEIDHILPDESVVYSYFYASFDVIYNSFFRIYYPKKKQIVSQLVISDTIFWENGDVDQRELFKNLSTIKQGLIGAGIKVALDLDDQLSPSWIPTKRGFFIIDKKNTAEQKLIDELNWEQLTEYWLPLTNSTNKSAKSKAEFNMALVSELEGNIDEAISWATKSYQTHYRNQTELYLEKLNNRKAQLIQIEKKLEDNK